MIPARRIGCSGTLLIEGGSRVRFFPARLLECYSYSHEMSCTWAYEMGKPGKLLLPKRIGSLRRGESIPTSHLAPHRIDTSSGQNLGRFESLFIFAPFCPILLWSEQPRIECDQCLVARMVSGRA